MNMGDYNQKTADTFSPIPVSRVSMQTLDESSEFPRYRLFDIWLNRLTLADIRFLLRQNISLGRKFILANQNLHSLYICTQDAKVREFFDSADYTHIDGTSLVLLGKMEGLPFGLEHRSGYMDLFPAILPTIVENNWRMFYLGSKPEVLAEGIARLRAQNPNLQIDGHHGYFGKNETDASNDEILRRINEFAPNILFVGMGMPLQERWILANFPRLKANAILHCGGMMDYIAGAVPTPPRWLGPLGMEWAFRVATEPGRLWRRYTIEPVQLLFALMKRRRNRAK